MRKHHDSRKSFSSLYVKKIIWILSSLLVVIGAIFLGYFLGFQQVEKELRHEREQTRKLVEQIQSIAKIEDNGSSALRDIRHQDDEIKRLKCELKAILQKEREVPKKVVHKEFPAPSAHHEYAPKDKKTAPPQVKNAPFVSAAWKRSS